MTDHAKYNTIALRNDGTRDVRFKGVQLGKAFTSPDHAKPDFSGDFGRWHRVELYRTDSGGYIVQRIHFTQWGNENNAYEVVMLDDEQAVIDWMLDEPLGREVLRAAGIEWVETVA